MACGRCGLRSKRSHRGTRRAFTLLRTQRAQHLPMVRLHQRRVALIAAAVQKFHPKLNFSLRGRRGAPQGSTASSSGTSRTDRNTLRRSTRQPKSTPGQVKRNGSSSHFLLQRRGAPEGSTASSSGTSRTDRNTLRRSTRRQKSTSGPVKHNYFSTHFSLRRRGGREGSTAFS